MFNGKMKAVTFSYDDGVTQDIRKATTADNKQIVYYLGTADLSNPYVHVYANYNNNDPTSWNRKSLINIAKAGFFSSDRSIRDYAEGIWDMKPLGAKK